MNNNDTLQYTIDDFSYNCLIYQTLEVLKRKSVLKNKQVLSLANSLVCLCSNNKELSEHTKSLMLQVYSELDKAGLYDTVGL